MSKQNKSSTKGNDQRSDSKNSNNGTHKATQDNKSNQQNPNHSASKPKK